VENRIDYGAPEEFERIRIGGEGENAQLCVGQVLTKQERD
jgi:hypothetical protein